MFSALLPIVDVPVAEVNVWSAHLDLFSSTEIEELTLSLDHTELARAERLHFEPDRRRYVVSHGLIRRLLGRALNLPPHAVAFEHAAHGKPVLASELSTQRRLHF